MLRLLGSCLILLGTIGLGYGYIIQEEQYIVLMEQWERIFQMLFSEINYKKQPLSFACCDISEKIGDEEGKCLKKIAGRMQQRNGMKFWSIWNEECMNYFEEVKVTGEMKQLILEFGSLTGFEDEKIQRKMIVEQEKKWKELRGRKQKEHQERKKLVWVISSCIGVMLILILW